MRSGASISSITAPISRTRRRKRSIVSIRRVSIIATCIVFIVTVSVAVIVSLVVIALSSSGQGDKKNVQADGSSHREDAGTKVREANQSLRRTTTDHDGNHDGDHGGLLIHTELGTIRIYFTPQLSGTTSIEYIQKVVTESSNNRLENNPDSNTSCDRCNFYRAEPNLLLQGVISQQSVASSDVALGPCPLVDWKSSTPCPAHDPRCGCHGPIMTRGMVGWAGGGKGPDFFINTRLDPVDWWEHQHTVWGQVKDEESLRLVEEVYKLPATLNGMRLLDEKINFGISLF